MYQENNFIIDLTNLFTSNISKIDIDINIDFKDRIENTSINELKSCKFSGYIRKVDIDNFDFIGNISGTMVIPDDITLECIDYNFSSEIDEKINIYDEFNDNCLQIVKNRLDITEFLWQNILVEIPLRVTNHDDLSLEGDGWCLTTEDEFNNRKKVEDSPFSKLNEIFSSEEE